MKEKRYQELTLPEKLIVGQIYDLYMEWISKRLGHKYLKNSLLSDFKFAHHISRTPFAEYADYFYMWGYEEELRANGDTQAKSPLYKFNKDFYQKLKEELQEREEFKKIHLQKLQKLFK